jgi:hypothetical protein
MNNIIKVAVPIAATIVGAIAVGVITKGKKVPISPISTAIKETPKFFGGLSQCTLDNIAKETCRGVKTTIQGDSLEFIYKTTSGKGVNSARFIIDETGKIVGYLGNGSNFWAKAPRIFCDKVLAAMRAVKL